MKKTKFCKLTILAVSILILLPEAFAFTGIKRSAYAFEWNIVYLLLFLILITAIIYVLKTQKLAKWVKSGMAGVLILSILTIIIGVILAWGNGYQDGIVDVSYAYAFVMSFPILVLVFRLRELGPNPVFGVMATFLIYFGSFMLWFLFGAFVGWIVEKVSKLKKE